MLTPWKSLIDCAQLGKIGRIRKVARQCVFVAIVLCISVLQGSICLGQENPLNPNYCEIQPFGTQDGWIIRGGNEAYGQIIQPVGDVNNDGVADWLVVHNRVDTSFAPRTAKEVLLYYGVRGGLPSPKSGKRIGPKELGSATMFLSVGHFDSDPYPDLVFAEEVFGDTTDGVVGFRPSRVVVYWGNKQGDYSNDDTSHLLNPGRQWLGFYSSVKAIDRRQTGLNDILIIWGGATFESGNVRETAHLHLFELPQNERWGRNGHARTSNWQWWNVPTTDNIQVMNQDGDFDMDLVLYDQILVDSVRVYTVYGVSSSYLDTVNIESVSLQRANGRVAEMTDITGDGIPDLIVNAGSQEMVKVFIGRRGHRLKEQYGTGIDPPDIPGGRPFARPWAQIKLPYSLDPTRWGRIGFEPLWDIGDIGNDGIADVVVAARPYMYVYSTGKYSDSYIDATLAVPNGGVNALTYAARLGDIDGSGRDAIAVSYGNAPGGIAFFHTSKCVEDAGGNEVPLPPGTGRPITSVEEPLQAMTGVRVNLQLTITPNPSTNRVGVLWSGSGSAQLSMHDALGNEAGRWITNDNHLDLDLTGWSKGQYILTVRAGNGVVSEKLVLQ
jgi:hypothetical protein